MLELSPLRGPLSFYGLALCLLDLLGPTVPARACGPFKGWWYGHSTCLVKLGQFGSSRCSGADRDCSASYETNSSALDLSGNIPDAPAASSLMRSKMFFCVGDNAWRNGLFW